MMNKYLEMKIIKMKKLSREKIKMKILLQPRAIIIFSLLSCNTTNLWHYPYISCLKNNLHKSKLQLKKNK